MQRRTGGGQAGHEGGAGAADAEGGVHDACQRLGSRSRPRSSSVVGRGAVDGVNCDGASMRSEGAHAANSVAPRSDSSERPVHAHAAHPKRRSRPKLLIPPPIVTPAPSQNKSSCARSCSSASTATRTRRIASSTTLARVHLHRPQLRPLTPCPNARRSSTSAATARRSTSAARASSRSSSLSAARRPRASRRTYRPS